MKDEIFTKPIKKMFEFDESVASVFDDMIARSIPFYTTSLALITKFLSKSLRENAKVVDLGCSTANTLLSLFEARSDLKLYGVDNSSSMIANAKAKAKAYGADLNLEIDDILKYDFKGFDAVILNYTLQFIRPLKRAEFVGKIYDSLNEGGLFVFSEKIIFNDKILTKNMIEIYEEYKQDQGYSKFEIAQKRQALENVLIPYSEDENRTLVLNSGFKNVESIFKWGNFMSFVAFK